MTTATKSAALTTVLRAYRFDTSNTADAAAHDALRAKLTAQGLTCFETWGGDAGGHYLSQLDGLTLTLETDHLFANQWNTAPIPGVSETGYRVFDWAQDYMPDGYNKRIKQGHYLEQTEGMIAIRKDTLKCGYCGNQEPAATAPAFCQNCLDSEYLKSSELYLTRLVPVDCKGRPGPLTEAEAAELLPRYRDAQTTGSTERGRKRIAAARRKIADNYTKAVRVATTERDGFTWLMDHGFNTENVIFYSHTERFGFGWRSPVDPEVLSRLLDVISEFPFAYDIKTADRTLSGER